MKQPWEPDLDAGAFMLSDLTPWQRQILEDSYRAVRECTAALEAASRRRLDAEAWRFTAWRRAT